MAERDTVAQHVSAAEAVGIRLDQVSVRFRHAVAGDVRAVDAVSLAVEPGELLTLLGPSGCGKTTTLRMIAGFQQPTSGRVWIGARDVTDSPANRRDIGFVFQNYALFPHLSVFDNVAYGLVVRAVPRPALHERVEAMLQMVGLARHGGQLPHQLSGGEQQRVALARAMVIRPRVLLFDEPLSNLDAKLRVQMRLEIRRLQKQLGITAVYVTHDQEEAMAISDRIAVMERGTVAQHGSAEDLYRWPRSAFVAQFIGRSNLIAARVRGVRPGGIDVEIAGVGHRIDGPAPALSPGAVVRLVVRPEAVGLGPPDAAGTLPATLTNRVYLGDKIEYEAMLGDVTVEVVGPGVTGGPAPGDRVGLRLPDVDVAILPPASEARSP